MDEDKLEQQLLEEIQSLHHQKAQHQPEPPPPPQLPTPTPPPEIPDFSGLPEAIADAVMESTAPLLKIAALVESLESTTDRLLSLQRQAITEAAQISEAALIEAIGKPASTLEKLATRLHQAGCMLASTPESLHRTLQAFEDALNRSRSTWWQRLGPSMLASLLTALLMLIGQASLSYVMPPKDAQIWARATAGERQALKEIASRPAR